MKRLFHIVIVVVSLFSWVCSAQSNPADQPATAEDVKKYFQVINSDDLFKPYNTIITQAVQESIHQMYLQHKEELPPDYEAKIDPVISNLFENMPWNEIIQAIIPLYQKHYTHDDMSKLIAFYSSPTGKKLAREDSALTAESMQYIEPIMKNYIETVKQKIIVETAEMIVQFNETTTTPDSDFLKSKDDIKCVSQKKDTGEFIFTPCKF
ncbi:MAG: DUF2059 domain-containing protein [Proteobacteria bacterium]|nr:DUF2059 domain-containing protein [Pseudomonadota bacterium]